MRLCNETRSQPLITCSYTISALRTSDITPMQCCFGLPVSSAHSWALHHCAGRIPAMFNGCVGIKPTVGRLSTAGVVPACASLDCVSVFAQTVEDAATVTRLARVRQ